MNAVLATYPTCTHDCWNLHVCKNLFKGMYVCMYVGMYVVMHGMCIWSACLWYDMRYL